MPAAGYFAWGCFRYFESAHLEREFSDDAGNLYLTAALSELLRTTD
jgi:hypothetical protein